MKGARYVFLSISVAGVLILAAEFNITFPWMRNVLTRATTSDELRKAVQDVLWKDLNVVSVPLIGIKFSAYDLGVVGSIALAILAVWFFYCTRRENHVVSAIVKEAAAGDKDRAAYLYHGIAHHFVFLTLVECDNREENKPQVLARGAVKLLHYIPVWVPLCVVAVDLWTLFMPHIATINPNKPLWPQFTKSEHIEVTARTVFCLALVTFSWVQCICAARFAADSRTQLNDVRQRIEGNPCAGSD